jgi:hypothetical protein
MKRRLVFLLILVAVLLIALRTAGGLSFWRTWLVAVAAGDHAAAGLPQPRLLVKGMQGGAVPRSTPAAESVSAASLVAADEYLASSGGRALIIHRHGHRVHEVFAGGTSGQSLTSGGELSPLLLTLAAGVLVDGRQLSYQDAEKAIREHMKSSANIGWRNPWSAAARQRFALAALPQFLARDLEGNFAQTLSQRVWLPLQAGDLWLRGRDDRALRLDCCAVTQLDNWTRVADLLLQNGVYQGERVVSVDWVRLILNADVKGDRHPIWVGRQRGWTGGEPPQVRDTYWVDLGSDLRIWIAPRRGLTIVHWADSADGAMDTTLPNIIYRGLEDQSPTISGAASLNDIVPGH